jgi:hypothetical protein
MSPGWMVAAKSKRHLPDQLCLNTDAAALPVGEPAYIG